VRFVHGFLSFVTYHSAIIIIIFVPLYPSQHYFNCFLPSVDAHSPPGVSPLSHSSLHLISLATPNTPWCYQGLYSRKASSIFLHPLASGTLTNTALSVSMGLQDRFQGTQILLGLKPNWRHRLTEALFLHGLRIHDVISMQVKVKLSLCLTNLITMPWRRMGKWMYRSTFSWPRH
jgi:hypothetical protein